MAYRRISSQTVLGGIVVLVGLLLLLDTTGIQDTGPVLVYVPSLFVLVGLYALVVSRLQNIVGPVVVIFFASVWQLAALDVEAVYGIALVDLWPLLVVLFGLSLLLSRRRSKVSDVEDAYVDIVGIFGGVERRSVSTSFIGGAVTALFGGAELDLRDVTLGERPARVNATALFGGVDVIVPRDWTVRMDVLPILGGAGDDRPRRERDEAESGEVDLVVSGFAAFGGVSVTD